MSHIGSKDIKIPHNVSVELSSTSLIIKGDLGISTIPFMYINAVLIDDFHGKYIRITPIENMANIKKQKKTYSLWGTYRTLISNAITGVSQGYSKTLELVGVGYKTHIIQNNLLVLKVGNSIDLYYKIPRDVTIDCPKPNIVLVNGSDKQRVNQVAAEVRSHRKPESYKGKGIRYLGEIVRTKEGKKK